MRHFLIVLTGLCAFAVVGIVISVAGTEVVRTSFLAWAVPFLIAGGLFAWLARGRGR